MKYLPYENYKLTTKLQEQEATAKLQEQLEKKRTFQLSFFGFTADKPYKGKVANGEFEIIRLISYRNSFRPIIFGKIESGFGRTTIHIKMRLAIIVYIFIILWFSMVGFAGAAMSFKQVSSGKFEPALLIVLLMFAFGYGITIAGFKYESNKSKKFLKQLFEGEEELDEKIRA